MIRQIEYSCVADVYRIFLQASEHLPEINNSGTLRMLNEEAQNKAKNLVVGQVAALIGITMAREFVNNFDKFGWEYISEEGWIICTPTESLINLSEFIQHHHPQAESIKGYITNTLKEK